MLAFEAGSTIAASPEKVWVALTSSTGGMPLGLFTGVRTYTLAESSR